MSENIGILLNHVSRLMRRSFDERARTLGVTRPQWQVLGILRRNAGINQGGLAEILEVEPITAGRMIDRMQDADLVERHPDPADRRAWRLYLTSRGEKLLDQLRPYAEETIALALEGLSESDRQSMLANLTTMRSNLTRKIPVEDAANG